jgi:hypothetical protein
VLWLFHAAGAPLAAEGVEVVNMRTLSAAAASARLDVAEIVGGPSFGSIVPYTVVHFPIASDGMWEGMTNIAPMQRYRFNGYAGRKETDDYYVHPDCVLAVAQQLLRMRFKRYQACPGVTITPSSFDDGEQYPIANGRGEWLTEPLARVA